MEDLSAIVTSSKPHVIYWKDVRKLKHELRWIKFQIIEKNYFLQHERESELEQKAEHVKQAQDNIALLDQFSDDLDFQIRHLESLSKFVGFGIKKYYKNLCYRFHYQPGAVKTMGQIKKPYDQELGVIVTTRCMVEKFPDYFRSVMHRYDLVVAETQLKFDDFLQTVGIRQDHFQV